MLASLELYAQATLSPAEHMVAGANYAAALEWLRANPSERAAWHLLASRAYDGLDKPEKAVEEAEAALALNPEDESAHLQLGQIFLSRHTPSAALEIFSDAQQLLPESFLLRLGRGLALKELGRYDEAAGELEKCLELKPSSGIVFDGLGTALLHGHQLGKLLGLSESFRRNNPADFRGFYYEAAARDGLGMPDGEVLELLRTSVRLNDRFAAAFSLMGKILLRRNSLKDAQSALERALVLRPDHVPSHMALAATYKKRGLEADAAREFAAIRELQRKGQQPPLSLRYGRGGKR